MKFFAYAYYTMHDRVDAVDALRGYAALIVVFAHLPAVIAADSILNSSFSPFRFFYSGHQAVILFFVLSGFSLSFMLQVGSAPYAYFFARSTRLYIPYIVSLALAICVYEVLHFLGFIWVAGWLDVVGPVFSPDVLLQHILMLRHFDTRTINPPIWSVVQEMRLSLLFPLILYLVRTFGRVTLLFSLLISVLLINFSSLDFLSIESTLHYATFFILGCYVATNRHRFALWSDSLPKFTRVVLFALAFLLYTYPFSRPWSFPMRALGDLLIGGGSALALVLLLRINSGRILAIGQWLGKRSFSLYLTHMLVLNFALIVFYKSFGALSVWIFTVPASLAVASLFHCLVDQPSIVLSRRCFKLDMGRIHTTP